MKNKVLAICINTYPDEDDMIDFSEGKKQPHEVKIYYKGEEYWVTKYFDEKYYELLETTQSIKQKKMITKEQKHALVDNYIKEKHSADECIGFIEGVEKAMELVNSTSKCSLSCKDRYTEFIENFNESLKIKIT